MQKSIYSIFKRVSKLFLQLHVAYCRRLIFRIRYLSLNYKKTDKTKKNRVAVN